MDNLIERKYNQIWQKFSDEMEEEFNQWFRNMEVFCIRQLEVLDFSYGKTDELLIAYRSQVEESIERTDEKWMNNENQKSLRSFSIWDEEADKISFLKKRLFRSLDRFMLMLEGRLVQKIHKHITENFISKLTCEQCNTSCDIITDIFKKQSISCSKCKQEVIYDPGVNIDEVSELLMEKLIISKCSPEYLAKELALGKVTDEIISNKTAMLYWDDFKHSYFTFYRKYFDIWRQLSANISHIEKNWKRRQEDYCEFEQLYWRGSVL
jgi:hypothetical protein